jgi:L-asparaginase
MKIAVIFTGGTIGSRTNDKWITVDATTRYDLLKHYENDKDITFKPFSPYNILSENLSANELNMLQNEIKDRLSENFDGIIVTHGSDTLQYSSTAVEMAFGNCEMPIIFVSADYPLDNEKSNGYPNFQCAVEFIRNKIANGVFVSYKNDDELVTSIHIPSRILMHNELNANIYSIDRRPFAEYNGEFRIHNIKYPEYNKSEIVNYSTESKILVVHSYPGQDYSFSFENTKAILFKSYHSATLDTANEKFVAFCKKATSSSVPMYVLAPESDTNYESTKIYKDLNINILPHGTFISAYMKLWADLSKQ